VFFSGEREVSTICVAVPFAVMLGFCALFLLNMGIKTWYKTNWLLAINGKRVLIKFRSYANYHFKNDDPQVVSIRLTEIGSVRSRKETLAVPSGESSASVPAKQLEIFLNATPTDAEVEAFKARLTAERVFRENTVTHDYPVSMPEDRVIRIEWGGAKAHVRPRIARALEVFSKQHVRVEGGIKRASDFTDYASWSREELDGKLRQLLDRGEVMAGHGLAKEALKLNTTQARAYLVGLRCQSPEESSETFR